MTRKADPEISDLFADPFGERSELKELPRMDLLGARFLFRSNSAKMLRVANLAFAALPPHRLSARPPNLTLTLLLRPEERGRRPTALEPPPLQMQSGSGYLIGATESSNFVCLSPSERRGVVSVSEPMLRYPYPTRNELLDLA